MLNGTASSMTPATRWREYDASMSDKLNENTSRWLCVVGDEDHVQPAIPLIEQACHALAAGPGASSLAFLKTLPTAFTVKFTTPLNRLMGEDCLAVHGRTPFLGVVDFTDEDDQYSYVLPLCCLPSAAAIEAFFQRVATGTEPRAPQGLRPTVGNLCPPMHGTLLTKARFAVAGNMSSLRYNPHDKECGTVCAFWSDRCPCCPGAVMMIESLVDLIDRVAAHHHAKAHGSERDGLDREGAARLSAVPRRRLHYISCNIDDNDYTNEDWPRDDAHQVVPTVVVYKPDTAQVSRRQSGEVAPQPMPTTPAGDACALCEAMPPLRRVRFQGSRTPEALVKFICRECLPQECECTVHITEAATTIARGLSGDELMRCLDDGDPVAGLATETFERTNAAYKQWLGTPGNAPASATADASKLAERTAAWTQEVLGAYRAARRALVDIEEVAKRAMTRLEDRAAEAAGDSHTAADGEGTAPGFCHARRPASDPHSGTSGQATKPTTFSLDTASGGGAHTAAAASRRFVVDVPAHDDVGAHSTAPRVSPPPQKRGREDSITDVQALANRSTENP